ncbi:MAG: CD225/dispanin family protein [Flavobacteriales bacterium]|nr:CD225/dispanin family protein [Flavobacteriales bacterium]MBK7553259.1 CD225/dispanin family protein [Flavobacteriales bacterium]MBK9194876.1 CD225/dispanin family protein [Flavobacteriales bacterium]
METLPPLNERPKNWLVESILVTIFCCLPFGIAGIVNAANVNSRFDAGDLAGAQKASKEAGKWTKVAFFVGLGLNVLVIIFYAVFFGLMFSAAAGAAAGGGFE